MKLRRYLLRPLAPLVLYSAVLTACWSAYFAYSARPAMAFEFLAGYFFCLLSLFWIVADARARRLVPCFDFGFLCLVYYPLSLPWYCVWSRGWRGVLTLMLLAGLWGVPIFVGALLSTLWSAQG
jgi:hypothetical protein